MGLAAAVLAIAAIAGRLAAERYLRARVLAESERCVGRPLRAGSVHLAPPFGLRLRDVRIEGVAEADEVVLRRGSVLVVRPTLWADALRAAVADAKANAAAPGATRATARGARPPIRVVARDATLLLGDHRIQAAAVSVDLADAASPTRIAARGLRYAGVAGDVDDASLLAARATDGWKIRVRARGVTIRHPAFASRPVGPFPLAVDAELDWASELHVRHVDLTTGALRLALGGEASRERMRAAARVGPVACRDALASLPRGLAPTLRGMRLSGEFAVEVDLRFERARPDDTRLDVRLPALCRVLEDAPAAPVAALRIPDAPVGRLSIVPPPIARLGPHVPAAFVAAEDTGFYAHHGFDLDRIRRAAAHDLGVGRFARGASTISQQIVKNLYLAHDRNLGRKLEEAVLTWRLEQAVPKRRILEVYLGVIELGPGLRGVTDAARAYFGREPSRLTPIEAAHLAALAPSPVRSARALDGQPVPWPWRRRLLAILDGMRDLGDLTRREWFAARAAPLEIRPLETHLATAP